MPDSKTIKISEDQANQRLDKFLVSFCSDKSRSAWQKEIQRGNIFINGKIAKPDYILKENDELIINENKIEKSENIEIPKIDIIYENNDVIAIDKPAGVVAQSAPSSQNPSVTDFLKSHYPKISEVGENESRFGIVHRLDKDTSGIMIAAKNNASFEFLKKQFKDRLAQKTYIALVYGKIKPKEGIIDFKIGRSKTNPNTQTAIDNKKKEGIKSREALTLYKTVKSFKDYSLLEVQPKTGRMHQIRVHLKAIGYPVVGDKKYFFKKYSTINPQLERQFLHASKLTIKLPNLEEKTFHSVLPLELSQFLDII